MGAEQQQKIAYEYGLVYSELVTVVAKLKNPRLIARSLPLSDLDILKQKAERMFIGLRRFRQLAGFAPYGSWQNGKGGAEKMNDRKIKCRCGCIKNRSELKGTHIKNKKGHNQKFFCCPDHPDPEIGRAKNVIITCIDCGKTFEVDIKVSQKTRCDKCQKKARNAAAKRQTARNKTKKKVHRNKHKCKSFDLCGFCIKPFFPCRIFDAAQKLESA